MLLRRGLAQRPPQVSFFFKFDIGCAGARGRGDGAADPRQVVQRRLSAGVVDENDGQILDCLEHVRHH
jgi:hypothetical protein